VSPDSSRFRDESDTVIARKLREVGQALDSITTQKDLAQFLNNTRNAQRLNDLVEDIRDALIGYQVCTPSQTTHTYHI
jgi:hypothetical protein